MNLTVEKYYLLSIVLFSIGLAVVVTRKHIVLILCGVELILNAANINFIAFYNIKRKQGENVGLEPRTEIKRALCSLENCLITLLIISICRIRILWSGL